MSKRGKQFRVGDFVMEKGPNIGSCVNGQVHARLCGSKVGVVVHIMKGAGLVIVRFAPSRQGIAFHPDDLEKM